MSTFKVPLTTIKEVLPHENAERLEVVKVYDWLVVTGKGKFRPGDNVVYVPVDSILPQDLEDDLFPPGSKITLNKHRVKSIKIRGHISQGMVLAPEEVKKLPRNLAELEAVSRGTKVEELDLAPVLGITKYEAPLKDIPEQMRPRKKRAVNPNFTKYTDIENFKWYDRVFQDGERVYISEKLHGTSFRAGWFKNEPNTVWKKIKKFFRLLPEWEFCWGSRMVQIQCKLYHKGYYEVDVYTKMVKAYNLKNRIPKGYAVYGEIVGDGIQKGYTYGCGSGKHELYIYDVQHNGHWLSYEIDDQTAEFPIRTFSEAVQSFGLKSVPCLYVGPYKREILEQHRDGDSTIGRQKVREGVILKPVQEATACMGRKVLKVISEAYYLKNDGTDFH
jgi:RNA ligase (TIGR02306 family)